MRKLYRNIAFVTSVFILALTAMLCVSYYQMQQVSPLETGVMETLKELNESNGENELLGQQIRELDLLSRKAYFVKEGQLKMGLYLLLGMALVLIVSLNLYYKETKTLPEKDFDPIDDWMTKSRARKYLAWAAVGATAAALALRYGVDLECGHAYQAIPEAIRRGLLDEAGLDRSVRKIIAARIRLGEQRIVNI